MRAYIQEKCYRICLRLRRRELPGSPMVRTPSFHCQGPGFSPCLGNLDCKKKKKNKLVRRAGTGNSTPLQYLAWKIPWMEGPGRLQSMGSLRVKHE